MAHHKSHAKKATPSEASPETAPELPAGISVSEDSPGYWVPAPAAAPAEQPAPEPTDLSRAAEAYAEAAEAAATAEAEVDAATLAQGELRVKADGACVALLGAEEALRMAALAAKAAPAPDPETDKKD